MIKKIRVEDLEPGMFISDFNRPWLHHPFFPTKILLKRVQDIDRMLKCGMSEVYIDAAKGKDSPKAVALEEVERDLDRRMKEDILDPSQQSAGQLDITDKTPFGVELPKARAIYRDAKAVVETHFEEATLRRRVDGESTHYTVADMIESIFRNRDALLSLARLKSFDQYTYQHSINVTVLALNLAVHMGILKDELLRLGIGALLHDIGKVRLPGGLIQKQGPLDQTEYKVVKTHAAQGASIIFEARSIPNDCATAPLNHHERYDGSGYPRGVSGVEVGKFGLITSIADVYDAMTSDRPYHRGMSANEALRRTYEWAGTLFHPIYVRRFIQCVGIYPIGSVVRLDTGEVGVVIRPNRSDMLRPWIRLAKNAAGQPLREPFDVDLREPDPREEKPFARTVARVLNASQVGIAVEEILSWRSRDTRHEQAAVALG